jgi:predicted lipid-binding transport protein (Tim44 family)
MKKTSGFLLNVFIAFCLLSAWVGESNAARLGGGRSFGSRPSYSTPYNRSGGFNQASPAQQPAYQQQPSMAAQRNQMARDAMGRRGGMMGMLGGLALGGLLGAMFFGGAFEGINFMDILLFAGVAFVLYKLFTAYTQRGLGQTASGAQSYGQLGDSGFDQAYRRNAEPSANRASGGAGFDTDLLSKRGGSSEAAGFKPSTPLAWPADFDAAAFLKGAKAAYAHLQQAWDNGDLAELRGLCNDTVFSELQAQLKQRVGENRTELLKVEAQILEVNDVGGDRVASVLFNVLLREAPGSAPTQVKEAWHFTRSLSSKQPTWYLDGIQQLEE